MFYNFQFAVYFLVACRLSLLTASAALPSADINHSPSCKYIPGDNGWPSESAWNKLNSTVAGRLIATDPIGHACHDPTLSNSTCAQLKLQWGIPELQTSQPAEILSPWFQNQSCTPFTPQSSPCTLGNYASYSINVSGANDIVTGLRFAQNNNIRLVIKNSGHDLLGKSTGKGALSLWTHNLKSKQLIKRYTSSSYTGPAVKLGAGVQGQEAAEFAFQNGYRVTVGSCPTVGIVGGYTQGGGHSSLTGLQGMGADNVLEWEVITADGDHVIATPNKNTDLYWALSGGGGGTYGVVLSMTTRLHKDGPVGQATFSFNVASTGGEDNYWTAVGNFHTHLQPLLDKGIYAVYAISNDTFSIYAILSPNNTVAELNVLMDPMITALTQGGLTRQSIRFATTGANTFYELFSATLWPILSVAPLSPVMAGRFLTRENIANNLTEVMKAMRFATAGGDFTLACSALNASNPNMAQPIAKNAVSPAWRHAMSSCIVGAAWNWGQAWDPIPRWQDKLTNVIMPVVEAATPDSAAYLNEASFQQNNWQNAFYGSNYDRLQRIKQKYDPHGLFYGVTSVGSEAWTNDGDGRLCRKNI